MIRASNTGQVYEWWAWNICKAKICPSLEGLNMTAGWGFSLTVVSVVFILTLSESLVTALFTALKTETEGKLHQNKWLCNHSEISQGSVFDYDMIILGTCINLRCVYDMCSFIQIKPQSKHHCLSIVIGHVWFGDCRENAVEFKCTFVCLCPWARQISRES